MFDLMTIVACPGLSVATYEQPGYACVVVHGSLDAATVSAARTAVAGFAPAPGAEMVLDLRGVGFLTGAGMELLVELARRCRSEDRAVTVCNVAPSLRHLLVLRGLDGMLRTPADEASSAWVYGTADGHETEGGSFPRSSS